MSPPLNTNYILAIPLTFILVLPLIIVIIVVLILSLIVSCYVTFDDGHFPFLYFHHPHDISDYDPFLYDAIYSPFLSTYPVSITPTSTPNSDSTSTIPTTPQVIFSRSLNPSMPSRNSSPISPNSSHGYQIVHWLS